MASAQRKAALVPLLLVPTLALAACGNNDSDSSDASATASSTMTTDANAHAGEHMMDDSAAPAGMVDAVNPMYPVGAKVIVEADHMPGMKGATATVSGAYATTVYSVSYTPTDGGEPVHDHRWVVQEELLNPGAAPLADGTTVTINTDHMVGMKGAKATIDSSTQETVYMVDITTADGMTMKNHKWVTESELRAA